MSGTYPRGDDGGSFSRLTIATIGVSPANGRWPVTISNRTTPRA
jgi:hypothetical protein